MVQTMLVIGACSMLSILTLSINGTFLTSLATGLEAQAQLNALSFGQALLDEILTKEYDEETTDGNRVFQNSEFTAASSFGADGASEAMSGRDSTFRSKSRFDDVDDYHNYSRAVKDSLLGWFSVTSQVSYAREGHPDSLTTSKSHYKVITVSVTHPNLPKRQVRDSSGVYHDVVIPVVLKDLAIYRRYF
jgi:hypothetical protein